MESKLDRETIITLYTTFDAPPTALDCGEKCAPHNDYGVPFCCDSGQTVPAAYTSEWVYLQVNTDLWHLWESDDEEHANLLRRETPEGMALIECRGHKNCQRRYRSIACRSFPFFPYITRSGKFIGLSYYWEYEDRCWLISHLDRVTQTYREEFIRAYDTILACLPQERENFGHYAETMRQRFAQENRSIPLLHRDGGMYVLSPQDEQLTPIQADDLPKFGVYQLAAEMPFADEQ